MMAYKNFTDGLYDERYKFTDKERDAESGYDYFGARFYWSLFKHWTSVDPMADKYPDISPYAYCDWNPIKNIDSDGREKSEGNPIVSFDGSTKPNASKPETFHIE